MKLFKKIPIRAKISFVIVAVSLLILSLATIIETAIYIKNTKKKLLETAKLEAKLLGDYCIAPLAFDDKGGANEVLKGAEALSHLQNALLYDTTLTLFASFNKTEYDTTKHNPENIEKLSWFQDDYLYVSEPIIFKEELFGLIHLRLFTGIKKIYERRVKLAIIMLISLMTLSVVFALGFQRIISEPIINLTKAVENITSSQNYSLRVSKQSEDEIGKLYEKFNHMLNVIQEHEKARNKALMELEENRERLKAIINNSPAVIYLKDIEGRYILVNKKYEELLEKESKEIIGKKDEELFDKKIAKNLIKTDKKVLLEKNSLTFEEDMRFDNYNFTFLSVKFPIYNNKRKIIATCSISTDITQRKQVEIELENYKNHLEDLVKIRTQELRKANHELTSINDQLNNQKSELEQALNKLKQAQAQLVQSEKMASIGVLTAGIAHEINNPINYISSGIEGLKLSIEDFTKVIDKYSAIDNNNVQEKIQEIEKFKKEIEYDELIHGIKRLTNNIQIGVNRTTEIIKGLRIFSRQSGDQIASIDIHENIDSTLLMLYNQYKNKIEIIKEYGDLPKINCYPSKINQVFMNLLSNAIQAIKGEGIIKITTRPCYYSVNEITEKLEYDEITQKNKDKIKSIVISIKDTGQGIKKEILENIFEPFFTTKEVGQGTGLGLSISYSIIQEHNGQIFVKSKLNNFTEFLLLLPIT